MIGKGAAGKVYQGSFRFTKASTNLLVSKLQSKY